MPTAVIIAGLLMAPPAPGSALERFFVGTTVGLGTVDEIGPGRRGVRDVTRGRIDATGALHLDQTVDEEGKPSRRRVWRLVRAGGNRITGTINDVRGPVTGELNGNVLHLRYQMRDSPKPSVEQWITLQPDGRSASNRMVFRRFGLKLATVESVSRRTD